MRLQNDVPALTGADADRFLDVEDEDLSVARVSGLRQLENCVEGAVDILVVQHDFQLDLGPQEEPPRRPR